MARLMLTKLNITQLKRDQQTQTMKNTEIKPANTGTRKRGELILQLPPFRGTPTDHTKTDSE